MKTGLNTHKSLQAFKYVDVYQLHVCRYVDTCNRVLLHTCIHTVKIAKIKEMITERHLGYNPGWLQNKVSGVRVALTGRALLRCGGVLHLLRHLALVFSYSMTIYHGCPLART